MRCSNLEPRKQGRDIYFLQSIKVHMYGCLQAREIFVNITYTKRIFFNLRHMISIIVALSKLLQFTFLVPTASIFSADEAVSRSLS